MNPPTSVVMVKEPRRRLAHLEKSQVNTEKGGKAVGHRPPPQHKKEKGHIIKGHKREAYSVLAGAGDAEVSRVAAGAAASAAEAAVPRAAKTSLARSRSGVWKVPSSILKSSF